MAHIDLIAVLDKLSKKYNTHGKLNNIKIYGQIERVLSRPFNLKDTVVVDSKYSFVDFHCFAVDLSCYHTDLLTLGLSIENDLFMVNGNIALYLDIVKYPVGMFAVSNYTLRIGTQTGFPYLTMFNFLKLRDNNWQLLPNVLEEFNIDNLKEDALVYYYADMSLRENKIIIPDIVNLLPRFYAEPNELTTQNNFNGSKGIDLNESDLKNNFKFEDCSFFEPENRDYCEFSTNFDYYFESLMDSVKTKGEFIDYLRQTFPKTQNINVYVGYMLDAIEQNLKRKVTSKTYTGRSLLKDYLYTCYPEMASEIYLDMTECGTYLIEIFPEIVTNVKTGVPINADKNAYKLFLNAFGDCEKLYAYVAGKLLNVSTDSMLRIYELCFKNNISISKVINENPYLLQCIGNLKFSDVENIACSLGLSRAKNLIKFKNIAMLDDKISDSDNGSTVFSLDYLCTHNLGVRYTEKQYKTIITEGTYISNFVIDSVRCFIKQVKNEDLRIDLTGFVKKGLYYQQSFNHKTIEEIIDNYVSIGLGVFLEPYYVTSTKLLQKELFVYKYMVELGTTPTQYSDEDIDKYIDEYEEIVGFKLEPEQRKAVHLLKYRAGVVPGSAGSGKTTTSRCFTYVLSKLDPNVVFKFATPTGKAAKRLQEVVKQPVKTMCSMFKTFNETDGLFDVEDTTEEGCNTTYIFDETAMVTIDLLYSVLNKINNSNIYLFGDFHQLPPIGKGLPFRNLLRFMPCQYLTVSKRAAEGSNITLNSNYINEYSESSNWRDLKSGKDFFLIPCADERIVNNTTLLVKYYLGKADEKEIFYLKQLLQLDTLPEYNNLCEDDIQVVTPLAKSTYLWGANNLNNVLQPLFNNVKDFNKTYIYQRSKDGTPIKFLLGDRVIHTNKNMYNMQWYSSFENGVLQKCYGFGINNGDIGKIVACLPAKDCEFEDEVEPKPQDFEYPESLRHDKNFIGENNYFIVVQYYDYLQDREFYILYRCEENLEIDNNQGKVFKGDDLGLLNLFYAGTTHKMQGSQSRLIIAPLGHINFKGFITRNMMYTEFTRGIDGVFSLGSVSNDKNSMLSRARMEVSEANILTIGELLFRE